MPTAAEQAPKSENKVPYFIPMKVMFTACCDSVVFSNVFHATGWEACLFMQTKYICLSNKLRTAIVLNKWTMEEMQSVLNPACGNPP
jgi:hypothetical protein